MKAIVIYDTKFGNTEKIAKALVSGIEEHGIETDCIKVEDVEIDRLAEYELLIIGGPTHNRKASKPMEKFLGTLESVDIRGKRAFAFDTKRERRFAGSAAKNIEKRLKSLGLSIIRPYSSAIVKGRERPLEEGMEEMFKQIAVEITRVVYSNSD